MATTIVTGLRAPAPPRQSASVPAPAVASPGAEAPASGAAHAGGSEPRPGPPLAAAWVAGPDGLVLRWVGPG